MERRRFLQLLASLAGVQACSWLPSTVVNRKSSLILLNDTHSRLNPVWVRSVDSPRNFDTLSEFVRSVRKGKQSISIAGYRHAMGGQQFAAQGRHLDTSALDRILDFDSETGLLKAEAGIAWPQLIDYYLKTQQHQWPQWGITQKQTGADTMSLAGSVSANAHGRGVRFKPLIQDIESLEVVDATGALRHIDRQNDAELFSLVVGGYGLFGVIASVTLRLRRRQKLERTVELVKLEDLESRAKLRLEEGYLYGDFQYKTDETAEDFMEVGVFSTYKPIADDAQMRDGQAQLSTSAWHTLLFNAFTEKSKAFDAYAQYYLSTNGQRYWSDTHQLSYYDPGYHERLAARAATLRDSTLMITEVYVPRHHLVAFTRRVAAEARRHSLNIIYGTMRLIEQDDETFLPWAKQNYACVIFNLEVKTSAAGIARAERDFQILIDCALGYGGSYFLTYHRFARKDQVIAAYPQFIAFLEKKLEYDPAELFQSEWYRHYRSMFAAELRG